MEGRGDGPQRFGAVYNVVTADEEEMGPSWYIGVEMGEERAYDVLYFCRVDDRLCYRIQYQHLDYAERLWKRRQESAV